MQRNISIVKLFVFITISFCIISSPVAAQSKKPVKVFLLGGQSNMAGKGKSKDLQAPYNEPFKKIKIWGGKKIKWATLSPTVFSYRRGQFGPEVSFGHAIAKAFPDEEIRLVKYALDGTALYNDWSPEVKGRPYKSFMSLSKQALADLDSSKVNYEIAGMLWLQGESDAAENKAEAYEKNLTKFIAHMRTEFITPDMPFIIARVRSHYGGKTGQAKIVRDAQVNIAKADKSVHWFDTDDCSMLNAGHYNAAGLIEIGKRFAATFQKVASNANDHAHKKGNST